MTRRIDPLAVPHDLAPPHLADPHALLVAVLNAALREVQRTTTRRNRRGLEVTAPQATATAHTAARREVLDLTGNKHLADRLATWLIIEGRYHEHGEQGQI